MEEKRGSTALFFLAIVVLFVFTSYLTQKNITFLESLIGEGITGIIIYLAIITLEIVFAPISVAPLIPIASAIWGWQISGLLSLIGWTVGSLVAFQIGKKYGTPLIEKKEYFKKIRKFESVIPQRNKFLGIVLLRLTIPFDIISYAIGIFTQIDWKKYTLATFIGYAPMAFGLAYLGTFELKYQILLILVGIVIITLFYYYFLKHQKVKAKIKTKWGKKFR